ncbi:MAG: hypothetical protein PHV20_01745 [Bacteroidales bacterium]|nr:hypothetical protein [Bacteroidales bacterium]
MRSQSYQTELKNEIFLLEMKQAINAQQLQKQLHITYESLKPTNLIKSTLQELGSSPNMSSNILSGALGLASGYLFRKATVGSTHGAILKLVGTALQFGVTNLVSLHADDLKHYGQILIHQFFRKTKEKV